MIKLPEKTENYKGILYFIIALLAAHFFWKLTMNGDENGSQVTFFGWDISQPFIFMAAHITDFSSKILNFIGFQTSVYPGNVISHPNHNGVCVIWGCTGLKQTFIFLCIMLFARGPWKPRLWYIPLGILSIYLFNIFRIVFITAIMKDHPQWFHFLHEHVLKYLFYTVIFLWWVVWEEKFAHRKHIIETENK